MHRLLAFGAPEYTLTREQFVPRPLDEVFAFFQDPNNLPRITPPELGFEIIALNPGVIRAGTRIDYRLYWAGIPYRWRTLIEEWIPGEKFVDTQLKGPYILWHHTHTFTPRDGGVLMADCVRYRLPFGPLGVLMRRLIVKRQLDAVFDYRVRKIEEIFGGGARDASLAQNRTAASRP